MEKEKKEVSSKVMGMGKKENKGKKREMDRKEKKIKIYGIFFSLVSTKKANLSASMVF